MVPKRPFYADAESGNEDASANDPKRLKQYVLNLILWYYASVFSCYVYIEVFLMWVLFLSLDSAIRDVLGMFLFQDMAEKMEPFIRKVVKYD